MKPLSMNQVLYHVPSEGEICVSMYMNDSRDLEQVSFEAMRLLENAKHHLFVHRMIAYTDYAIDLLSKKHFKRPLGLFISSNLMGTLKLHYKHKSLAVVSNSFHIKPLLKIVQYNKPFMVIEFSQGHVNLYLGSMQGLRLIDTVEFKESEFDFVFAGHLEGRIQTYIDVQDSPLILAGHVGYANRFYESTILNFVLPDILIEPFDYNSVKALHQACLKAMRPINKRRDELLAYEYMKAQKLGQVATHLKDIAYYAKKGRIKHLFVSENQIIWGEWDKATGKLECHDRQLNERDDDLLDDFAQEVLKSQGKVSILPKKKMPERTSVCAIIK